MRVEGDGFHIDWRRTAVLATLIIVSVAASYFLQPLVSGNQNAINTVVTVFSILAGFLMAVITFIGDPGGRGWKDLQLEKSTIEARLRRHRFLFYLYLMSLGLALAMFLIPKDWAVLLMWFERFFVGISFFVFVASFTLPQSLMALQMERYNAALQAQLPPVLKKPTP